MRFGIQGAVTLEAFLKLLDLVRFSGRTVFAPLSFPGRMKSCIKLLIAPLRFFV